jgi:hypothetical protein
MTILGVLWDAPMTAPRPIGPAAGDHDDVVEAEVRALDGVQRARERLRERGVVGRDLLGDLVGAGERGDDHVLGHRAVVALEAEHRVGRAHPVPASLAVHALAAGHDLLAGDAVADLDAVVGQGLLGARDDLADQLVAGGDAGLDPAVTVLVAPELGGAVVALQVARAHADGLDLDEQLVRRGGGDVDLLEPVVLGCVHHDGLHGSRDLCHLTHLLRYVPPASRPRTRSGRGGHGLRG